MSRDSKSERSLRIAAIRALPAALVAGWMRSARWGVWVVLTCPHCSNEFALLRIDVRKGQVSACPHCFLTMKLPEVKK